MYCKDNSNECLHFLRGETKTKKGYMGYTQQINLYKTMKLCIHIHIFTYT